MFKKWLVILFLLLSALLADYWVLTRYEIPEFKAITMVALFFALIVSIQGFFVKLIPGLLCGLMASVGIPTSLFISNMFLGMFLNSHHTFNWGAFSPFIPLYITFFLLAFSFSKILSFNLWLKEFERAGNSKERRRQVLVFLVQIAESKRDWRTIQKLRLLCSED